ncbi:hypothetical protein A8924_1169 [Saccharopolyspora erythraea NRRL 2338]|uniref:Uncharacterized protein n=1 Tax=Saccharopolyspora erythraea TaxID=1836 RepID=A0ABP3P649_SACER|nr:hypothetical protein [Saccharopolyspora erythraea]EQD83836.1 hypothetical protein N599_23200 [Saccharopolyspora erythraea D]PFG93911.1 hypothetical protein A8924_1169 [Saccharopolyspora erythraea NRRL 2338]QRK90737.1 hypothetical protein JQX30_04375 [Saccharopolyspora erythraea]
MRGQWGRAELGALGRRAARHSAESGALDWPGEWHSVEPWALVRPAGCRSAESWALEWTAEWHGAESEAAGADSGVPQRGAGDAGTDS